MDFWMTLTYSAKKQNAASICKMPPSHQFFKSVVSIRGPAKKLVNELFSPRHSGTPKTAHRSVKTSRNRISYNPRRFIQLKCVSGLLMLILFVRRRRKNHVISQ